MPTVQRLLAPLVQVRQEEIGTLLLMFCYSFLAMTVYNVVKPSTPNQKVLAMPRVPVFSGVSATEMRHLAAIAHQVALVPAAIVSAETDPPVVCVVLSGAVSMEAPGDETVVPSQAESRDVTGLFEALAWQDGDA